jgi:hypothetical protein
VETVQRIQLQPAAGAPDDAAKHEAGAKGEEMRRHHGTYWNGKGRHQRLYDRLYPKLVPDADEAGSDSGELLRTMSNVYYDIYNNGGCNLLDAKRADLENFESLVRMWGITGHLKTFEMIRGFAANDTDESHCESCECPTVDNDQRHFTLDQLREPLERLVDAVVVKVGQMAKRKMPH